MEKFDKVRRKLDPAFTGTVLLDPQGGVVYVRVDTWGETKRSRTAVLGMYEDLLEVVEEELCKSGTQ